MKIQINEDKLYEIIASSINKNLSEGRFGRMAGTALLGGALMLGGSSNAMAKNRQAEPDRMEQHQQVFDNIVLDESIPKEYTDYCKKIAGEISKGNNGCTVYVGYGDDSEKLMSYRMACATLYAQKRDAKIVKSTVQTTGDIFNIFVFGI